MQLSPKLSFVPLTLAFLLAFAVDQAPAQAAAEAAGATAAGTAAGARAPKVTMPSIPTSAQAPAEAPQAPAQAPTIPPGTPQQAAPPETVGVAPLRVMVGKSILVNTADRLRRVSVTDPSVADAMVVTPNQVLVHGRAPGEVTLLLWDEQERSRSFDLRVDVDVTAATEEMKRIFPDEQVNVSGSRSAIVLSGHVSSEDTAKRAGLIATAYTKNVINVLTFGPQGAQEVLLEVKFAEVDHVALSQLGMNIFATGAAGNIGNVGTGQFPSIGTWDINGQIGAPLTGTKSSVSNVNPLNLFLFRPDLNLGAAIKALQERSLMEILAEPNLIAVNGKEASFLAGGEFPIPVVQGGAGGNNGITIQFREFGVRLSFMPVITPAGAIHLQVKPEVSSLDFANGIRLNGFVVPALTTRRASTELEIQDGQSFVIAGLMDNRVTKDLNKVPGIGDIPILGNLFKSRELKKSKTELMVLVTAHRIQPLTTQPPLPKMPEKFMEDGKTTQTTGKPVAGGQ